MRELGWYGICKLEIKHGGDAERLRVHEYVLGAEVVAEEFKRPVVVVDVVVVDVVLVDQLCKQMTSNIPLPSILCVGGEVALGLKMGYVFAYEGPKVVN